MSKRALTAKEQEFTDCFEDNSNPETYHNVKRSYMKAYPKSSGKAAESNGVRLIRKDKIKQVLNAITAKRQEKIEYNRQTAIDLLNQDYLNLAKQAKLGSIQAIQARTAIIRELNAISNLHRATVVSEAVRPQSDPAEAQALKDLARAYKHSFLSPCLIWLYQLQLIGTGKVFQGLRFCWV